MVRFATDIPEGASASFGLAEVSLRTTGQPAPGFCAATALGASISLAGVATPETWRVPIHVHVVAIDDAIFNADRAELVAITLCSEDEHFNFDLPDVAVTSARFRLVLCFSFHVHWTTGLKITFNVNSGV